mgnify:CR=1 FL=1
MAKRLLMALLSLLCASTAHADAVEDFYKGKTVTIVIGATPQTTTNVTLTITGGSQLVNRTTPATGVSIGIAATGQTAGTSNTFNITAGTPTQYTLSGPGTVTAGAASTNFTITIQDAFGNTTNTTQNTTFTRRSRRSRRAVSRSSTGVSAATATEGSPRRVNSRAMNLA